MSCLFVFDYLCTLHITSSHDIETSIRTHLIALEVWACRPLLGRFQAFPHKNLPPHQLLCRVNSGLVAKRLKGYFSILDEGKEYIFSA